MPRPRHARLLSAGNTHLQFIPIPEGFDLVAEGYAHRVFGEGLPTFRLNNDEMTRATPGHSQATLDKSDMQHNAEAAVAQNRNAERIKVDAWHTVHDTFAVTIVDGRALIPDPRAAEKRVKQMMARKRASR